MNEQASEVQDSEFPARFESWVPNASMSTGPSCWECQATLELFQPDETMPDRLVGVCPNCRAWTLVFLHDDGWIKLTDVPDTVDRSNRPRRRQGSPPRPG